MSDGPGPDAHPHHCWSSSGRPGADRAHCISNRQEEKPCWIPDHLNERTRHLSQTWQTEWWRDEPNCVSEQVNKTHGHERVNGSSRYSVVRGCFCISYVTSWIFDFPFTSSVRWWSEAKDLLILDGVCSLMKPKRTTQNTQIIKDGGSLNLLQQVHHQLLVLVELCSRKWLNLLELLFVFSFVIIPMQLRGRGRVNYFKLPLFVK